jgi:hypothetical protein
MHFVGSNLLFDSSYSKLLSARNFPVYVVACPVGACSSFTFLLPVFTAMSSTTVFLDGKRRVL